MLKQEIHSPERMEIDSEMRILDESNVNTFDEREKLNTTKDEPEDDEYHEEVEGVNDEFSTRRTSGRYGKATQKDKEDFRTEQMINLE